MKNKILQISLILLMIVTLTACKKEEAGENIITDAVKFKEEYEALNGTTNSSGKEHRTVNISEDNPFIYTTPEDLVKKINNNETFYVYFGSTLCPWCRSAIEKAIEVAKESGVEKIYYIDIWDNEGNEILRDKYILNSKNKPEVSTKGTDAYYEILEKFDNVLSEYNLTDENGNSISTGEKRIYAPNYIYVKDGVAVKLVEGTSPNQKDSREELTEEMLKDEEAIFTEFFSEK